MIDKPNEITSEFRENIKSKLGKLPSVSNPDKEKFKNLQVFNRSELLGITFDKCITLEFYWKQIISRINNKTESMYRNKTIIFDKNKASELNAVLRENQTGCFIDIASQEILLDEAIVLSDNVELTGRNTKVIYLKGTTPFSAFLIENCTNVKISGFSVMNSSYAVYCVKSSNISIAHNTIVGCSKRAIVLNSCANVKVSENRITETFKSGIYIFDNSCDILIQHNTISNGLDIDNRSAGITITSVLSKDKYTPEAFLSKAIRNRLVSPHDIVIYENTICNNEAQGIYLDGPHYIYVMRNTMKSNRKEGICCDWGTIGAIVNQNSIHYNGFRFLPNEPVEKKYEKITHFRLPGISLDNTMYNLIEKNIVSFNAGSGIKSVRSSFCNIISENVVDNNNLGRSKKFFGMGIELGYATPSALDHATQLMDFTSNYHNIVMRNLIVGKHYAGIYMSPENYRNEIFRNVVLDCETWSLLSRTSQNNLIYDNIIDKKMGIFGVL